MKVTKIGTINNGIDGIEHYFSIIPGEDETRDNIFEQLEQVYYYPPSEIPGRKFIDRMHLIDSANSTYIFIIIEKYDV